MRYSKIYLCLRDLLIIKWHLLFGAKKVKGKATNTTNISCLLQTYPFFSGKLVFRFFFVVAWRVVFFWRLPIWFDHLVRTRLTMSWWIIKWFVVCAVPQCWLDSESESHVDFFGLSWEGSREDNLGKRILGMQVIVLVVCNIYAKRTLHLKGIASIYLSIPEVRSEEHSKIHMSFFCGMFFFWLALCGKWGNWSYSLISYGQRLDQPPPTGGPVDTNAMAWEFRNAIRKPSI